MVFEKDVREEKPIQCSKFTLAFGFFFQFYFFILLLYIYFFLFYIYLFIFVFMEQRISGLFYRYTALYVSFHSCRYMNNNNVMNGSL